MRLVRNGLRLSASDVMRFKGCRHATSLDLRLIEVGDVRPSDDGEEAELLRRQGDAHEAAFLSRLHASGRSVVEIPGDGVPVERAAELTLAAMRRASDVVFRGALLGGSWGGTSDFLERVDRPSALGDWSYEVVDTKLKRRPDPGHVLQLSLYSDLLADAQGVRPEAAHLELGDGTRFTIDLSDVESYARHARATLRTFIDERPPTRPEPVAACGLCRWRGHCRSEWERKDDLSLVAGISRAQRRRIEDAGVDTLAGLAGLEDRVPRMSAETQLRLRTQARLQMARRAGGPPGFVLREAEPGKGFDLLPEPDEGDLFYDIEGDPYHEGGLEYLHGVWFREAGEWSFRAFWAHDRAAEGRSLVELLDFLIARIRAHPRARIYHYANYEIAALRRLTAAHRMGEAAMDQLQRERRFVDLFKVVSGSLVASEKGYSIKDLEAFYMEKRDGDVATAGASVVYYEKWRETGDDALLDMIHDYNRVDCVSTQLLRDWLVRDVRPADLPWPLLGLAPSVGTSAVVAVEDDRIAGLRRRLEPVRERLGAEAADLLLDLAFFHEREDKPAWWAIFDRLARESEELLDDLDCLQGLVALGPPVRATARSHERTYAFPAQETKLRAGSRPCVKPAAMPEDVDLRAIDHDAGTVVLRRSAARGALPDRLDLLPGKPIANATLRNAIAAVIERIVAGDDGVRAIEHLLTRGPPVFRGGDRPGGIVDPAGDLPSLTSAAIAAMDETTLAIQGPPGTGKTYVGALAIVDLVRSGRRVAVSSNSHKAIGNLLEAVAARAAAEGTPCRIVRKTGGDVEERTVPGIVLVSDNDAPEIATADVVGATAWHFARHDAPTFDHLFIDEAGQVSLANVLAMARAARNLVLVGDPMQLPQPLQGTHPGRSGASCLEHLIGDARLVPADRGVFMPISRRMHPSVCGYVSTAVYGGRLRADGAAAGQLLSDPGGVSLVGAGVRPVTHLGRAQVCPEEVAAIAEHVAELVGSRYRDRTGTERRLALSDILVVAPYNAQVNALRAALPPAVRVGTVDRFQGQEAPVCLVSMTTSSGEEMPRAIAFLFSLNRINVAVSRAQVRAVVFASPLLLETPCRSVGEMALVNALCLLREHGGPVF